MATKAKKVKKAPAKKAAPKKVAKKAAKKVVQKKSAKKVAPKKKVAVKKVAAKKQVKKVVKKPVVKRASAKKPIKKVAPKKASPKKIAPKKAVKKQVKKAAPKKNVSKVAPKKQVALKMPVKKVAPKRAEEPAVKASKIEDAPNIKKEIKIDEDGKAHVQERYSDADLQMFKEVILKKLAQAKDDYEMLRAAMTHSTSNDIEDTSPTFKVLEEGASSLSKEESGELAQRQYKFIQSLEAALVRIENKTYGISRISGELIPKARLLLVPHATLSVEDKNKQ
jgi:DnaK suppressor protein